jgi:hypothetical protein
VLVVAVGLTQTPASGFNDLKIVAPIDSSLSAGVLTHDPGDKFSLTIGSTGKIKAAAYATNTGANTRVAWWRIADPALADEESCATWKAQTQNIDQEGAALRLEPVTGGYKLITVTKNVYLGNEWVFNVHVWDTSNTVTPYTLIAQFKLKSVFKASSGQPLALPWSICAKAVGTTVSFIVWPSSQTPPTWGDPAYGGSVTLPSGYDYAGEAGWYFGHLQPGDHIAYSGIGTGAAT